MTTSKPFTLNQTTPDAADPLERHESLRALIESVAYLLPAQGPITAFVHHNTLHAFENMQFDNAVEKGARVFGCEPYLAEETYRQLLEDGRIRNDDIVSALLDDLVDWYRGWRDNLGFASIGLNTVSHSGNGHLVLEEAYVGGADDAE